MQEAYLKPAGNLTGECFAPSQAGQKPLEQPELQVLKNEGPTACVALRPSSRFFRGFSGTAAQTALGPTRNRQDLPENAFMHEKKSPGCENPGRKLKSDTREMQKHVRTIFFRNRTKVIQRGPGHREESETAMLSSI